MNEFQPYQFRSSSPKHTVELLGLQSLTEEDLQQWRRLGESVIEQNPFIEPDFIVPLIANLKHTGVGILVVRDLDLNWYFAIPVVKHVFEFGHPLPKLRALRSPYIFLDQPLISRTDSVMVLTCLFDALSGQKNWHGLGLAKAKLASEQLDLLKFCSKVCGVEQVLLAKTSRPAGRPQDQEAILKMLSSSRRKSLRRGWKRLEELGDVSFRIVQTAQHVPEAAAEFLRFENMGWKGENRTSMNSSPADRAFFREMCLRFAQHERILFGEILLNGEVIASTCNLIGKQTLFAFKVGWNPEYSACSLGYWSEILLADEVSRLRPEITLIDSCSEVDSYTGKVWLERIEIGTMVHNWSRRARIVRNTKVLMKKFMNR